MKKKYTILKTGRHELTKVAIDEILYLKAFGNYTDIVLDSGKKLTICQNIKSILNHINSSKLIRISRNGAVNKNKTIKIVDGREKAIVLANNEKLSFSKSYISNPLNLLR